MTKSTKPRLTASIPLFSLFGEAATVADAEFVHIEEIAARSSRYGWEITPHAHRGLFQALLLFEGEAEVRMDERLETVRSPAAIIVPPAAIHAFRFAPETHGYVLTVAEALLFEERGGALFEDLFLAPRILPLDPLGGQSGRLAQLAGQAMEEFRWPLPGRPLMLQWLVRAVLMLLQRQQALGGGPAGTKRLRVELFNRFRVLVEDHFHEHWTVARYAAAVGCTESRLDRLCRDLAGKSAFEVARDRLLLEAKRKLVYIAAPVSALAYELGFEDPAYFGRFFRKLTGLTPAAFRARAQAGN